MPIEKTNQIAKVTNSKPLVFFPVFFLFAGRQEKIDEEFGYTEREDD
jgi:hypothetical protein